MPIAVTPLSRPGPGTTKLLSLSPLLSRLLPEMSTTVWVQSLSHPDLPISPTGLSTECFLLSGKE